MFTERYERKLKGNSLILTECQDNVDKNDFEERMISENRIKGFLPCLIRAEDEKNNFVYDITSKQSLSQFFEERELTENDLLKIIKGIVEIRERILEYLLSDDNLVLNPQYLFIDPESRIPSFLFYPYYHMSIHESLLQLGTFLLERTNHKDEKAVTLVYGFYKNIVNENYSFEELIETTLSVEEAKYVNNELPCQEEEVENEIIHPQDNSNDYENLEETNNGEKTALIISLIILLLLTVVTVCLKITDYKEILFLNNRILLGMSSLAGAVSVSIPAGIWISNVQKRTVMSNLKKIEEDIVLEHNRNQITDKQRTSFGKTEDFSQNREEGKRLVCFENNRIIEFKIDKDVFTIGKSLEADGCLDYKEASRIHAKIRARNGEYYITDMNSTNGTKINGKLIDPNESVKLSTNDEISFAGKVFYFR